MGKIVLSTNVTLDGVGQDPAGDEGFEFGGWFNQIPDEDREPWAKEFFDEAMATDAILMGARSYEWFAPRWVGREGAWADRLASLPKYVVRSGDGRSDWGPTTVLAGDVVEEVTELKQQVDGHIALYASYQLVQTLVEHDLLDEARLMVFPHVVGSGGRVFTDLTASKPVRLTDVRAVGTGLVQLRYGFGRQP
ncbi:MAG TPA: dihydrofolate reductase family protein [Jatrophihabitans sp.]|jgi:dihydrofolate reductase